MAPGIVGLADTSISAGELLVQTTTQGGEAIIDTFKSNEGWRAKPFAARRM